MKTYLRSITDSELAALLLGAVAVLALLVFGAGLALLVQDWIGGGTLAILAMGVAAVLMLLVDEFDQREKKIRGYIERIETYGEDR